MKNCLVTKLKDVVVNSNLLKLNEIRFSITEKGFNQDKDTSTKFKLCIGVIDETKVSIIKGNATIYQLNESTHSGKVATLKKGFNLVYINAKEDIIFSIENKNSINALGNGGANPLLSSAEEDIATKYTINIDFQDLRYINPNTYSITIFGVFKNSVENLDTLVGLEHIYLADNIPSIDNFQDFLNTRSTIYGNGDFLLQKGLSLLMISKTKITGDISKADFSNLSVYEIYSSSLYGDITNVELPLRGNRFVTLGPSNNENRNPDTQAICKYNLYGDLGVSMYNHSRKNSITELSIKNINTFYGNVALLPPNLKFFTNTLGTSKFSYSKVSNNPRIYIYGLDNINLGDDLDAFLLDMSKLQAPENITPAFYRNFSVIGKTTEASKEAIQILTSKGFNVVIKSE